MRRYASLCAATLVIGSLFSAGCGHGTSPTSPISTPNAVLNTLSASSGTDVLSIPVSFTIQPAAKTAIQACVGEVVSFVGDANVVAHQTALPDGSTSLDLLHFNGQGAVAVGGSTGTTYRLVGGDSNPIILPPSGVLTATFEANLLVIGPGSTASFMAHILQQITITPAGDITALVDFLDIVCQ